MALAVRSTRRSLPAGGVLSPLRSGDATLSGVARQGGRGQSRSLHPRLGIAQSEGSADHCLSGPDAACAAGKEDGELGYFPAAVSEPNRLGCDRDSDELRGAAFRADADADHLHVDGIHLSGQSTLYDGDPVRQPVRHHCRIRVRLSSAAQTRAHRRRGVRLHRGAMHHLSRKSLYLVLAFGALFQFFVLLLNTSIWIYAPELFPT